MSDGNTEQIRIIANQIADAAVARFEASDRRNPAAGSDASIPPILKWLAGVGAVLLTLAIGGTANWLVNGVSTLQITVTRMDERLVQQASARTARDTEFERRLEALERKQPAL